MLKSKSCYTVYNQHLAGHLMTKGFKLEQLQQREDHGAYHVFFFHDSYELRDAINTWMIQRQKEGTE